MNVITLRFVDLHGKPLSATLNIPRILSTPHTPAQISALWNAYHASQSSGTGRGYLSATVPFNLYEKMLERAKKYPLFVLPLPREAAGVDEGSDKPVEFHLMEWGFHGSPPHPSSFEAPSLLDGTFVLDSPHPPPPPVSPEKPLPAITTILFTSLQEYKLHQSYAQPRLVLTHYTDLVQTHGIVLLRGEITQGTTDGRYTMSQIDAQMLALGVQRFYLGDDTGREELLKSFHEKPNEFEWERVIEKADIGVRL
jgi:ATP synthase F1 complex assembly factor 1